MPESSEHKEIKEKVVSKLKDWFGGGLSEFHDSGHRLDSFTVTLSGISLYCEIIWDSSPANFHRDLGMMGRAESSIKLAIVNPKILEREDFVTTYTKEVFSQRKRGVKMWGTMINGSRILSDAPYLDVEFKQIIDSLIVEFKDSVILYDYNSKINEIREKYGKLWADKETPYMEMVMIPTEQPTIWLPQNRETQYLLSISPDSSGNYLAQPSIGYWEIVCFNDSLLMIHTDGTFHSIQDINNEVIERHHLTRGLESYRIITYYGLMRQIARFVLFGLRVMKKKNITFDFKLNIYIKNAHMYPIMFSGGLIERSHRFSDKEDIIEINYDFNSAQSWSELKGLFVYVYKQILLSSGYIYDKESTIFSNLKTIISRSDALSSHTVSEYVVEGVSIDEFEFPE